MTFVCGIIMVLVCFDMDNTLVRADAIHIAAFNMAFKDHRLPKVPAKELKKRFGVVAKYLVKDLFPHLSLREAEKVVKTHDKYVVTKTAKKVKVIRGAKGALAYLKAKGYKLCLLSNCKHKEIEATMKHAGIPLEIFTVILGNDEVKRGKPHPDVLLKAKRLAGAKFGYMVGDTIYDIEAGKKAGFKTIAVLTGNHTRKMLKAHHPDYILKSVAEIKKIL